MQIFYLNIVFFYYFVSYCLFKGFVDFDKVGQYGVYVVVMVCMLCQQDCIVVMDCYDNVGGNLWVVMFVVVVVQYCLFVFVGMYWVVVVIVKFM